MLVREFIKDDVKVRAESLAYLMIFSILPIVAGFFFVFTFLTQFGMVQEAIGGFVDSMLSRFPNEQREFLEEYTLKFKDSYLASIQGKSGSLGVFALAVLGWVGLQTLNNVEKTLNQIWSSEHERPFMEKVRNFLVVAVASPLVIVASLSLPLILKKTAATREILAQIPTLTTLIDFLIPICLILGTLTLLYRYVPVTRVYWKSAFAGGVSAALMLQIVNYLITLYFHFGTSSPYGKAAAVPLVGLWIYVVWVVVILGAEVSFLVQNEQYVLTEFTHSPSLLEIENLLSAVICLQRAHNHGENPVSYSKLHSHTALSTKSLNRILSHLQNRHWILKVAEKNDSAEPDYVLAKNISNESVSALIRDFLSTSTREPSKEPIAHEFEIKVQQWIESFGTKTFSDYLK
jgi:membrane protein